jgi:AhpD family alkylhydroperoxidase
MTWINTVPYDEAEGRLKSLYDRVKGPDNNVDNIMMSHSLRPHTMEAHMTIYKYVLHHTANQVPKWFLECIGVLVSHLNGCGYCFDHHYSGMARLVGDATRA